MKKSVKLVMIIVLLMAGGCTTQKKEENTRIIDTSMFLYKVSDQKGGYSYLFGTFHPGRYPIKSLDKVTEKALDESDSIYLECDMKPSPKETEEITKYNTYNSIRDLGLEDKYENLMKQYKSLKGKPGYALYNVFVINSLINSDPEVLNKANISKFSAIDNYIYEYAQKKKNFKEVQEVNQKDQIYLCQKFVEIGKKYNIEIYTCHENESLKTTGVYTGGCTNQQIIERALSHSLKLPKINEARQGCRCLLNNDIGVYNTCLHSCLYCYANYDRVTVLKNIKMHNKKSPFLIGDFQKDDIIKEAKQVSYIDRQLSLF